MFVVTVDVDKCQACGDCIDSCPQELLALVEEEGKKYAMFKAAIRMIASVATPASRAATRAQSR